MTTRGELRNAPSESSRHARRFDRELVATAIQIGTAPAGRRHLAVFSVEVDDAIFFELQLLQRQLQRALREVDRRDLRAIVLRHSKTQRRLDQDQRDEREDQEGENDRTDE